MATGLLLGAVLWAQSASLDIEDNGAVSVAHQKHHTKRGRKVVWTRKTGAAKSWFVVFAESPCAEGARFGSGEKSRVCTIRNDAPAKSYKYSSATSPSGPLHDPEIVVDEQ
ncbi:MAG: hypothetical protein HY822_03615 [Acidobacteria bacterium]|nr:hypothetical protein [Acidobacteriota bacterium]